MRSIHHAPFALTAVFAIPAFLALLGCARSACAQEFSVHRDFDVVRSGNGDPIQNIYWVSLPLDPVLEDLGNPMRGARSFCVGDPGGPAWGDGVLDSVDLLCAWWTARTRPATAGFMIVRRWDSSTCAWITQVGFVGLPGRVALGGTSFPYDRSVGYAVQVGVPLNATYSPRNPVTLAGNRDTSWPGHVLDAPIPCGPGISPPCCVPGAGQMRHLIVLPFEAACQSADEVLCGLRNVDWVDLTDNRGNPGPDGNPDTCWDDQDGDRVRDATEGPTGIYDGVNTIAVGDWSNLPTTNFEVGRQVAPGLAGRLQWQGVDFSLESGRAYMVHVNRTQLPTLWRPPAR